MITLEVITFARGEEVERRLIGAFTSRRAAKRAALGSHHRECIRAWPSHLSTVAIGEAHIGGRPHRWLSEELEEAERSQETAAKASERGKALARRANESRFVGKAAGSAGAIAGAFVGARFARGIDAAPIVGAALMAGGIMTRGVLGDVLADAGGAAVGGALGAVSLCKAMGSAAAPRWARETPGRY